MNKLKITAVLPCFGRPMRTRRMIECIATQSLQGFEIFIIGDQCPDFDNMLKAVWWREFLFNMDVLGNRIEYFNQEKHTGGWGFNQINYAIARATGEYFMFLGNDDIIRRKHFQMYYEGIENVRNISQRVRPMFAYANTWIDPIKQIRIANLNEGGIGHSELIIDTYFLKDRPKHKPIYGHDWHLVQNMCEAMTIIPDCAIRNENPTYFIMSIPDGNGGKKTFDTID